MYSLKKHLPRLVTQPTSVTQSAWHVIFHSLQVGNTICWACNISQPTGR